MQGEEATAGAVIGSLPPQSTHNNKIQTKHHSEKNANVAREVAVNNL